MADDDDDLLTIAIDILRGASDHSAHDRLRQHAYHCILPSRPCRLLLYSTKGEWLMRLCDWALPPDVALVWRHGPLGPNESAFVGQLQKHLGAPLRFVGDLDPLDLATYATLASAVAGCTHLGVGAAWLSACEADRAEHGLRQVCIQMEPHEQSGLARLTSCGFDWSRAVGERCHSLLASGLKLELEGASNPALYSPTFNAQLRTILLS